MIVNYYGTSKSLADFIRDKIDTPVDEDLFP